MARSIVLRFDATCVDCGASLPAGSTARWFGRGRVSCCGSDNGYPTPNRTHPEDDAAKQPPTSTYKGDTVPVSLPPLPPVDRLSKSIARMVPLSPAAAPATLPAELDRALACGMQSGDVTRLAELAPDRRLCVRLTSGARFVVTARDAQHVLACIVESCRDSIRDVMGAAL